MPPVEGAIQMLKKMSTLLGPQSNGLMSCPRSRDGSSLRCPCDVPPHFQSWAIYRGVFVLKNEGFLPKKVISILFHFQMSQEAK